MGQFTTLRDEQDARTALLRYYSSECVAHGAYILTIALGIYGLFEVLPNLSTVQIKNVIMSLGLSAFFALGITIVGRLFFWGYLASAVLRVKPSQKVILEEGTTVTLLDRLHKACSEYVKKKHKLTGLFSTTNPLLLLLFFFILLFILYFILPYVLEL